MDGNQHGEAEHEDAQGNKEVAVGEHTPDLRGRFHRDLSGLRETGANIKIRNDGVKQ